MLHIKQFEQGKQGVTGLLELDKKKWVYKISRYMNDLPIHEYHIIKGLQSIRDICPHFCDDAQLLTIPINKNFRKEDVNPFEQTDFMFDVDVLLLSYVDSIGSLSELIQNVDIPFHVVVSCVKQVLIALIIAQRSLNFVHYDLHSDNILIKKCPPDLVHIYKLDDKNVVHIPTYGYIPIIIDYGFSYSKSLLGHPLMCSVAHTDYGLLCPAFDPLADVKKFLVVVCGDIKYHREPTEQNELFRTVVKNLFNGIQIDWETGLDLQHDIAIIDKILNYIEDDECKSELFLKYDFHCIDILQSLITLPLKPVVDSDITMLKISYHQIIKHFSVLESDIKHPFLSLYVFHNIVTKAREIRVEYQNEDSRENAIKVFKDYIDSQIKLVVPGLDRNMEHQTELFLCSLYVFADYLEASLYYMIVRDVKYKLSQYKCLDCSSNEGILGIIDHFFPSEYPSTFNTISF
jgi:hypothetical protein